MLSSDTELRKMDPHQVTCRRRILNNHGVLLVAMAPGTGKTLPAIRCSQTPSLVICRPDDFLTWQDELQMENVRLSQIHAIEDSNKLPEWRDDRWYLVSYDRVKKPAVFEWIRSHNFHQVVWDEFDACKRWDSARTKANFKATRHIRRRLGLTGSPITNHVIDVFSLCLLLDDGRTFGTSKWHFENKHYLRVQQGGRTKGLYQRRDAKEKIQRKLRPICYYVHEDDVLKLPPLRPVTKGVPMTGIQRRHYEAILTDWETTLASGEVIELDYVITQMGKLKQIAGGFMYDEHHTAHWFRNHKMPFLFKMLTDKDYFGEKPKTVIWASYTAELERICEQAETAGISYVPFFGKSRHKRNLARREFRTNSHCRLFVGQVDSGRGINDLIVADTAIWYSNSLKVNSKMQSQRRTRRRGSEIHQQIHHVDICTEGTLDLPLAKSIRRAMNLAHEILSACREGISPRQFLTT
jgi:SNF2 family DNA or RNA helicase